MDAILQHRDVEVDEQAEVEAAKPQVGEELGLVERVEGVDGLDLNHHPPVDHKVHDEVVSQCRPLVDDR